MMTFEALLELIQTRQISYVAFYDNVSGGCVMHTYEPIKIPLTDELVAVTREYQGLLYYYLFTNDIQVCTDPANHEQFYVQAERYEGEEYTRCTECARIRSEAMLSHEEWVQRQADGSSIELDFRKPRHHE